MTISNETFDYLYYEDTGYTDIEKVIEDAGFEIDAYDLMGIYD